VAVWPASVRRRLRQLWADHDELTAVTGAAERTLCHLDVWPANLDRMLSGNSVPCVVPASISTLARVLSRPRLVPAAHSAAY
jgi:hypothetical protein